MATTTAALHTPIPLLPSATEVLGRRLLHDLTSTEESLESLLLSLRQTAHPNSSKTNIPTLDVLIRTHSNKPSSNNSNKILISGRSLPLIYHLIISLVSAPCNGTVVVLDLDRRFSVSHLASPPRSTEGLSEKGVDGRVREPKGLSRDDLAHVHVFRPTASNLASTLASIEGYMLSPSNGSRHREWKGIFITGSLPPSTSTSSTSSLTSLLNTTAGVGAGKEVLIVQTAWRGWLRVEKGEVGTFAEGMAVEEAWGEKEARQEVVDAAGWRAWDLSFGGGGGGEVRWD